MTYNIKKLGILGGTFNPIHNGHIEIALSAKREYGLEQILMMPSGISYLKAGTGVLKAEIRKTMVEIAIEGYDGLICDDREQKREGNSYTCDTIIELDKQYDPDTEFYYIIGADTLLNIHMWKNISVIFNRCKILVAVRSGAEEQDLADSKRELEVKYDAKIYFLHCPYVDISSSMIREKRNNNQSIEGLVPSKVEAYIMDNKLYL